MNWLKRFAHERAYSLWIRLAHFIGWHGAALYIPDGDDGEVVAITWSNDEWYLDQVMKIERPKEAS